MLLCDKCVVQGEVAVPQQVRLADQYRATGTPVAQLSHSLSLQPSSLNLSLSPKPLPHHLKSPFTTYYNSRDKNRTRDNYTADLPCSLQIQIPYGKLPITVDKPNYSKNQTSLTKAELQFTNCHVEAYTQSPGIITNPLTNGMGKEVDHQDKGVTLLSSLNNEAAI